jgi:exopolysaccharide production protein ExoQ
MVEVLVAGACYLTFFANLPGIGTTMQVAALGLLAVAAGYAVLLSKVKAVPTSPAELVLYAVGVTSAVLAVINAEPGPLNYSLGFLSAMILISIVARVLPLERFLDIGAVVALLCVITSLAIERGGVLTALSGSMGRTGLIRLTPLGNHPNLTGYIFGAGSILMIRRLIISKSKFERVVLTPAVLLSWLFILGASARSSILGLVVASGVAIVFEFRGTKYVSFKWIGIALAAAVILGLAFPDRIVAYFTRILELDSSTRGVASGGSGRSELWLRGIATLFDDPVTLAFGGGFRSSSSDVIGFSTESSYVTILLDSGLFVGVAVILVFLYSPIKALSLSRPRDRHASSLVLLASLLTFLLAESVFNRYLLAVGNPASLLTLLIMLSLSMRRKPVDEAAAAPDAAAPSSGVPAKRAPATGVPAGGALRPRA